MSKKARRQGLVFWLSSPTPTSALPNLSLLYGSRADTFNGYVSAGTHPRPDRRLPHHQTLQCRRLSVYLAKQDLLDRRVESIGALVGSPQRHCSFSAKLKPSQS